MSHPSPWSRLLLVSVVLPATIVAADSLALSHAQSQGWPRDATVIVFGLFLAQVAAMGHLAGRYLPNWPWRLLILVWSAVLIDLLLYSTSVNARQGGRLLVFGFFGSQIAVGVIWAILGLARWRWRLPAAAAALAPATYFIFRINFEQYADVWLSVVFVQTLGVLGLAGLLRAFGHRIEPITLIGPAAGGNPLQFSIQHMLIWTTAAAIIVMAAKQVVVSSAGGNDWRGWLQIAIDGVVLAVVVLAAMWLALGGGRVWLAALVALLIAGGAGAGLWCLEVRSEELRVAAFRSAIAAATWYFYRMPQAGGWWVAWTLLAGSFLACLLLVFRATGYRLVRRRRTAHDAVT